MSDLSIIFDDKKFQKNIFYRSRKSFNASDTDNNKIVISKRVVYETKNSLKYFTGYIDADGVIRPLLLKLPQMIGYLKEFNDSMTMSLRVDDSKLFKKYCKIWKTIKGLLGTEFESEPVYGDTDFYIKTKVKMYDDKVNTNFQGKETPTGDSFYYKCLSLIMLDSAVKVVKKYYPQVFLQECKYVKRKNKMFNYINDDLEMASSDHIVFHLFSIIFLMYFNFFFLFF